MSNGSRIGSHDFPWRHQWQGDLPRWQSATSAKREWRPQWPVVFRQLRAEGDDFWLVRIGPVGLRDRCARRRRTVQMTARAPMIEMCTTVTVAPSMMPTYSKTLAKKPSTSCRVIIGDRQAVVAAARSATATEASYRRRKVAVIGRTNRLRELAQALGARDIAPSPPRVEPARRGESPRRVTWR